MTTQVLEPVVVPVTCSRARLRPSLLARDDDVAT